MLDGHKGQFFLCIVPVNRENTGESIVYLWVEKVREFMVEFGEEEVQEPTNDEVRQTIYVSVS